MIYVCHLLTLLLNVLGNHLNDCLTSPDSISLPKNIAYHMSDIYYFLPCGMNY